MKNFKRVLGKIFLLGLMWFFPSSMAFSEDDVKTQLRTLSERMATLEAENAQLRSHLKALEGRAEVASAPEAPVVVAEKEDVIKEAVDRIKSGKEVVKVGKGTLCIGGLLQGWWQYSDATENTFRLRRTEIKFYGEILPTLKYTLMIDPAKTLSQNQTKILEQGETTETTLDTTIKQSSRILQDMVITWVTPIEHWSMDFGQFKTPITDEGLRSSSKLDTIERGNAVRAFGDKRDIGLMVKGSYPLADLYAGLFNGEEMNVTDKNDHKDPAFRGVVKPFALTDGPLKLLELGGGAYIGESGTENLTKDRFWGEGRWEWERISVKGEYIVAKDGSTDKDGWYIQGAFYLLPKQLQGVLKYDVLDLDTDKDDNEEDDVTVGLNYFILDHNVKVQLNYIHKNFASSTAEDENQVIGALQVAY